MMMLLANLNRLPPWFALPLQTVEADPNVRDASTSQPGMHDGRGRCFTLFHLPRYMRLRAYSWKAFETGPCHSGCPAKEAAFGQPLQVVQGDGRRVHPA